MKITKYGIIENYHYYPDTGLGDLEKINIDTLEEAKQLSELYNEIVTIIEMSFDTCTGLFELKEYEEPEEKYEEETQHTKESFASGSISIPLVSNSVDTNAFSKDILNSMYFEPINKPEIIVSEEVEVKVTNIECGLLQHTVWFSNSTIEGKAIVDAKDFPLDEVFIGSTLTLKYEHVKELIRGDRNES